MSTMHATQKGEPAPGNSSSTPSRWAEGYNRLPDHINEGLSRIAELYYGYHGYSGEERRQMSRRLMVHVNAILHMDADARAAWHQENLRLIAEVEKTAKPKY